MFHGPDARIEIHVSCAKLKKTDRRSKSDPCCILSVQEGEEWKEVGRTEVIKNNENPEFTTPIAIEYYFQRVQKIRFAVYDFDGKSTVLKDENHLGFVETTLGEVVSGSPFTETLTQIKGKQVESTITLHVEEASKVQASLLMKFSAQKLDKKDTMSKSDPFLTFNRKEGAGWKPVHRTEVIKDNLNPTWAPVKVKLSALCDGDHDNPVKIDCYDYDSDGDNDLIGTFTTTVRELIKEGSGKQWPVINPQMVSKKGYKQSGTVILSSCEVVEG